VEIQKLKYEVSPFAGISLVNEAFCKLGMNELIDKELGGRGELAIYSYSDIIRNLSNVFISGGDVIEDIGTHLGIYLKAIPDNNVPSPDTASRGLKELSVENTIYTSKSNISYNFSINDKLNSLMVKLLMQTGQLKPNISYDFDYDNQIVPNKKYDSKRTYKKNKGYAPGIATIGDKIVYIENRDGNANVKFEQAETLKRAYANLAKEKINVNRSRMDAGSYSKAIIDVVDENSTLFYIRANKSASVFDQIREITEWEAVEINHKKYQVGSISFKQFNEDKNYRLVIMKEETSSIQFNMFTNDTCSYRTILTNDWESTEKEVIEYYNNRGKSEKIFDVMNNDFGWKKMPFSFLNENNVFMIITAIIMNFYCYYVNIVAKTFAGISPTTRLKRFIFRFINVAGRWVYQGRRWILKLHTNKSYEAFGD